jgi:uncharacterized protein (DUF58 family)
VTGSGRRRVRARSRRLLGNLRALDGELRLAVGWTLLAALGWWVHSIALALIGSLGAVTTAVLYAWQRSCLVGLGYRRSVGALRANFGDRVSLEIEITNDKLLPLAWCRIEDVVPAALAIEGVVVGSDQLRSSQLVQLLPILPYQRVRRRFTINCTQRGLHEFGPATITSGDPLGLRARSGQAKPIDRLLVYPKIFALAPAGIVSRVLLGEQRVRFELLQDPSRVAGVRPYRPGDTLRDVDWRSTARCTSLLVREFDPTVTLRVAIFVDFSARFAARLVTPPELEFAISVAASVVVDLAGRKIATGLYSSGVIDGRPLAFPPSTSPAALPELLEGLARASSIGRTPFSGLLLGESGRLARGTSVVVIATDFSEAILLALSELRRRHSVTAIFVDGDRGRPPPGELVDGLLRVAFTDDWAEREVLELAR